MAMTSRERMLTAMAGGTPDRVPASPDTNWMIPARLRGGPFWQVYYHGDPPIWKAYNDSLDHFGIDGFSHHGKYNLPALDGVERSRKIISENSDMLVAESTLHCPAGTVTQETTFLRDEAPTPTKKWITDFEKQYEIIPYILFGDVDKIHFDSYRKTREDMGERGVVGLCMHLPTLLTQWREPVEAAFYDYFEHHDLLSRLMERWTDHLVEVGRAIIDHDLRPDFVFFPNSGMITMQSEDIMREYSLPALKKLTRMFKEAGILTSQHCCGKERALVEAAALETDLDCIDPLEVPPMGDCDLVEIKREFGGKLALKGNLHTTEVMLRMDRAGVEREARKCLEIGKPGGGFILSTGDQCGRDTPDENIRCLVDVCEQYGHY
ncbi:MAG: uroporphyrinogen decarboxylase family protein [Candidatus Sumerlaeota bacterium]